MQRLSRTMGLMFYVLVVVSFFFASDVGSDYAKVSDISYRQESTDSDYALTQCQLDLYYPKESKDFPTVVWFHGGGLTAGNRRSGMSFAQRFTAEGIGVVLVSYRLSPRVKHPEYIEDAAAAVAWTFKNISKYGGDQGKVFISGHSAGGYLAAMVGMDERYLEKQNMSVQMIAGIIPISGQMVTHTTIIAERGIPEGTIIVDEFAPIYHTRKVGPACLCICGDSDIPMRCDENVFFIAGLKNAGNKDAYCLEVKGRNHGSIVQKFQEDDDEVTEAMLGFIRKLNGGAI